MKSVLLFFLFVLFNLHAFTQTFPTPTGLVSDFENLFTLKEEQALDSLIRDFGNQTTIQIAIVTLDSTFVDANHFDAYTLTVANQWGIGKADVNNGILIAVSASLRRIRIHNGYGIEKMISDAETKQIIDTYFIPNFKNGDYFIGVEIGTEELIKKLNQSK